MFYDLNYFLVCRYDAVSFVDPDQGNEELNIKIPQDAVYLVNGESHEGIYWFHIEDALNIFQVLIYLSFYQDE